MFQFLSLPLAPYVFRYEYHRITSGGFPHSEIPGSKVGQHLTRAYRSRPRPSSALGAKASTVCPSSLDREEHVVCRYGVFKVRAGARPAKREKTARDAVSQNSAVLVHRGRRCSRRARSRTLSSRPSSPRSTSAPDSLERR